MTTYDQARAVIRTLNDHMVVDGDGLYTIDPTAPPWVQTLYLDMLEGDEASTQDDVIGWALSTPPSPSPAPTMT